jgi:type I restriction enzyme M protein
MLIKGEDADNIVLGDTFTKDGFDRDAEGKSAPSTTCWPTRPSAWSGSSSSATSSTSRVPGLQGASAPALPRINDGALLFLQHMIDKMRPQGRRQPHRHRLQRLAACSPAMPAAARAEHPPWIIENDWLEAVVALPDQLFYNTGISTYIWVLTNRKEPTARARCSSSTPATTGCRWKKAWATSAAASATHPTSPKTPTTLATSPACTAVSGRQPAAGCCSTRMARSSPSSNGAHGMRRRPAVEELVVSKVFDNDDFGYHKITVERPLRLNFQATPNGSPGWKTNPHSRIWPPAPRRTAPWPTSPAGEARQQQIRDLLAEFAKHHPEQINDRKVFLDRLKPIDRALNVRLSAPELKAVVSAIGERDETPKSAATAMVRPSRMPSCATPKTCR